jgi:hypothetical protein
MRRLRRLAALLSLIWDAPISLRDGPSDHLGAIWAGAPGPVSGQHYGWWDSDERFTAPYGLPDLLDSGEVALAADGRLAHAVLMHHEAMTLARGHPSIALVAFVSAIEAIAQISKDAPRCDCCKQIKDSTQCFRDVIAGVLPDEQAAYLTKSYEYRSEPYVMAPACAMPPGRAEPVDGGYRVTGR